MRAWPHAVISSLGARAREGGGQAPAFRVARCLTRSLVDIRLGPIGSRQGSSGTRMGPYLSRTPIRAPSSHPSGLVGSRRDTLAKLAKVRSGPKTSNLVRNGSRIDRLARNKNQMNRIGCPDPSGPLLKPKTPKNPTFQEKRPPAAPLTPIGAGRGLHSYWLDHVSYLTQA